MTSNRLLAWGFVVVGMVMLVGGGVIRNHGSAETGLIIGVIGLIWAAVGVYVVLQLRRTR